MSVIIYTLKIYECNYLYLLLNVLYDTSSISAIVADYLF